MVPLKHNSTNGKLNKARLARLIAKGLLKISYIGDVVEDTKGVIRIRKSKMNRLHNVQKKKYKGTKNDLNHRKQKIE